MEAIPLTMREFLLGRLFYRSWVLSLAVTVVACLLAKGAANACSSIAAARNPQVLIITCLPIVWFIWLAVRSRTRAEHVAAGVTLVACLGMFYEGLRLGCYL